MDQLELQGMPKRSKPVNVSSVPQRSPFRYPGGKTWLVPRIRDWLGRLDHPKLLVEPFAGGGIVSLTAAFENLAEQVIMVELDRDVAAVWQTVLSDDVHWLVRRIGEFDLTFDSVRAELEVDRRGTKQRAFQTILKNRTFHGGILAPGAGLLKNGESGRGVGSRWYPETLQKRLSNIAEMRDRISFLHGDGIEVMRKHAESETTAFFIDPPYTAPGKRAGSRLYRHSELDHDELFRLSSLVKGDVLMTYDNGDGAKALADEYGFDTEPIAMQNTHLTKMNELLIGRDLTWARGA